MTEAAAQPPTTEDRIMYEELLEGDDEESETRLNMYILIFKRLPKQFLMHQRQPSTVIDEEATLFKQFN